MLIIYDILIRVNAFAGFVTLSNSCLHLLVLLTCTYNRIMHGLWIVYSLAKYLHNLVNIT
jgi:hypothetical protein